MTETIFTVARGGARYREMALGLGRSLRLIGNEIPTTILTDIKAPWERYFDRVIRTDEPRSALDKLKALDLTDAHRVIALDCDSLVFRRVEPVFAACRGLAFAVQGDTQSEGWWHERDVATMCRNLGRASIPRFNGGFVYYERTSDTELLLAEARRVEREYGTSGFGDYRGKPSEEVCISLAMMSTGIGEILPDEMDFMSTAVGLVGSLKMDVRTAHCEFLCRRARMRYIRPYVFHAARYSNFLVYWRQLARLRRLAGR